MVFQKEIILSNYRKGYHLITDVVLANLPPLPENGLLTVFVKHTSAGITLNENENMALQSFS